MTDLVRDPAELRHRLAERTLDLRTLDLAGFRRWLELQLSRWQGDPVFVQRARIRDLRRAHPELGPIEDAYRRAKDAHAASPATARVTLLARKLHNVERAIAGLEAALAEAPPDRQGRLAAKRADFLARRLRLTGEVDELNRTIPERQSLLRTAAARREAWERVGLDRELARLAELQTDRGRRVGRAGAAFEVEAVGLTRRVVLPDLGDEHLHVLRAVRLGAAGVELDLAVVRRAGGADDPVEALAVVEAKRNINDLAHGFQRRQIDLGWLTGKAGYDPTLQRTGQFPTGHFDRPAVHWQDGQAFVFTPDSFCRFAPDPESGYFLNGLYLVTRAGSVWGLSGANQARVAHRVATDEDWDPADDGYLSRLFDWCRSLAGPVESPDVLRRYTGTSDRSRHLLITDW